MLVFTIRKIKAICIEFAYILLELLVYCIALTKAKNSFRECFISSIENYRLRIPERVFTEMQIQELISAYVVGSNYGQ
jgi:hypothetical protein